MKIFVAGNSHLTHYTKIGAAFRGLHVTNDSDEADLILIAQDTYTDKDGKRNLAEIEELVFLHCFTGKPVILMSQVPPGFCRKQNRENLYHYPETLRIKDSYERACNPEYIIIGSKEISWPINSYVEAYARVFNCPVFSMVYEAAEFSKIAVNMALASQVIYANKMNNLCEQIGINWENVKEAISNDKRISKHSYLTPGRWEESLHLLRDSVTVEEICTQKHT